METALTLDGRLFAKMVHAGCDNLRAHVQAVNDLNVFPIPDGDTGSNMVMTLAGGADAAGEGTDSLSETARRISDGMLLSARGNSGVILSQIFDGISAGFEGIGEAGCGEITSALQKGVEHAYSAVMEPTEGTMLTVMRCAAGYVSGRETADPEMLLSDFLEEAERTLAKTPDMLPVLKKAGVVDSGGAGLVRIIEGMLGALRGEEAALSVQPSAAPEAEPDLALFTEDSVLEYGYCTELLLRLQRCKTDPESFEVSTLTDYLGGIGDSMVAFKTGSIVKIHIHTMTPDRVLAFCQKYGEFLKIKIENMSLQHSNAQKQDANAPSRPAGERKAYGVVAVASGEGIRRLFAESGADVTIDGGQSMNPSAADFLEAFRQVNADTILVLPNNGNILLTARQAAGMYKDSDVRVIESRTVGDGYSALAMLSTDSGDTEQIVGEMTEAMRGVVTAGISKSVRDTEAVHAGDYIGFVGKDIIASGSSRAETVCETVARLAKKGFDVCIVIRGKNAGEAEADDLREHIASRYPGKEVYLIDGMQEIYDYILIIQ